MDKLHRGAVRDDTVDSLLGEGGSRRVWFINPDSDAHHLYLGQDFYPTDAESIKNDMKDEIINALADPSRMLSKYFMIGLAGLAHVLYHAGGVDVHKDDGRSDA